MNDNHTLDLELSSRREQFYAELGTKLDVEAGLAEVLLSERHSEFSKELRTKLDVEAGLAAIVPPAPPTTAEAEPKGSIGWARAQLTVMPLQDRLTLRAYYAPTLGTLSRAVLRLKAREIERDFQDWVRQVLLGQTPLPSQWGTRLQRNVIDEIAQVLQISPETFSRPVTGVDIVFHDTGMQRNGRVNRNPQEEDLVVQRRELNASPDGVSEAQRWIDGVVEGVDEKTWEIVEVAAAPPTARWEMVLSRILKQLAGHLETLEQQLNDFTGVDLRNVDLAGVPLEGLRWSIESTRWPEDWVEQIKHDSIEVGDGIYEIYYGSHTPSNQTASV
ncbi:hypothetical protein [Nocardia sp. XZ_19_385]|uniref:hypothetical protein n=1 Tax=Nocardia sp. XZ_19_385 TaxID=2769488 RepID=UPI0018904F85|nr:hypothetical protein [Nocardia sp. XZ_19_385]